MAPETRKGKPYSLPADMYSLAVTVEEIARAGKPTSEKLEPLLQRIVRRGRSSDPLRRPTAKAFLQKMQDVGWLDRQRDRQTGRKRASPLPRTPCACPARTAQQEIWAAAALD
mmetsp:Transcript_23182/g.45202  ORF Transcript_23182/g.45202 Transcript_23182/m.45202 type:complete len:113 (+) Transcript_23182:71-409(+)